MKGKVKAPTKSQEEWAMDCVRLLIAAYVKGDKSASIEWSDIDSAYEAALEADPGYYLSLIGKGGKKRATKQA